MLFRRVVKNSSHSTHSLGGSIETIATVAVTSFRTLRKAEP